MSTNTNIPHIDLNICIRCGVCQSNCPVGAIVEMGDIVMILPQLCVVCGNCIQCCPVEAVEY